MILDLEHSVAPLLGVAGWSDSGKTSLLEALLPRLRQAGLKVAVIKHTHHGFALDRPGKDSDRLRQAGATPMLIASRERFALLMDFDVSPAHDAMTPDLSVLLAQLQPLQPDLILVEGFKTWPLPKIELHRASLGKPLMAAGDPWIRAVASDAPLALPTGVSALDIDDLDAIAAFMVAWPALWDSQRFPREPGTTP